MCSRAATEAPMCRTVLNGTSAPLAGRARFLLTFFNMQYNFAVMDRLTLLLPLVALAACTQEPPPPAAPAEQHAGPVILPAPVDANGLSPLAPPPSTAEATREPTPLEIAVEKDDLDAFIRELAGRKPTENLLHDALSHGSQHIVHWLCDKQQLRLTKLERGQWPGSIAPSPDSPECHQYIPELDAEALAALQLLAKAYPGMVQAKT